MSHLWQALYVLVGYLVGSISFPILISRLVAGIDIREHGSGNAGGSNVARVVGLPWGILAGTLDILKAIVPPLVARGLGLPEGIAAASGVAAVIGHNWPLYFGFRGGRGVASSLGVLLLFAPREVVVFALVAGVLSLLRESALGVFLGFPAAGLAAWGWKEPTEVQALIWFLYLILLIRRLQFLYGDVRRKGLPLGRTFWNRLLFDTDVKRKLSFPTLKKPPSPKSPGASEKAEGG